MMTTQTDFRQALGESTALVKYPKSVAISKVRVPAGVIVMRKEIQSEYGEGEYLEVSYSIRTKKGKKVLFMVIRFFGDGSVGFAGPTDYHSSRTPTGIPDDALAKQLNKEIQKIAKWPTYRTTGWMDKNLPKLMFAVLKNVALIKKAWDNSEAATKKSNSIGDRSVQLIRNIHLFSHFDSRGGSFMTVGGSRSQAIAKYNQLLFQDPNNQAGHDDYRGKYSMTICDVPTTNMTPPLELLYDYNGKYKAGFIGNMIVLWVPQKGVDYRHSKPEGVKDGRLGEDACGLVVF